MNYVTDLEFDIDFYLYYFVGEALLHISLSNMVDPEMDERKHILVW